MSFSPDGTILAAGVRNGTIRLWDVTTGQNITTLKGHTDFVSSVSFSPDGTILASSSHDNTFKLWDVATGQNINTFDHGRRVSSVSFSPDGTILASSSWGMIKLWEVTTGTDITTLTHKYIVRSMVFSPDGTILASGGDSNERIIKLWDVTTGENIAILEGHTSGINSLSFSPDGETLASAASGTILLWDIETLKGGFNLSMPIGISLIHVPLKVTVVDGVARTITSVSDLYDALGGTSVVNFLITYDSQQGWLSFFVPSGKGGPADVRLTDDKGVIVGLRTPVSVRLRGTALGTNGTSTITLNPGLNVVGLPLNDSRITRVSNLLALNGISGNVPVIILTDGGEFKLVGRAGDPGDIAITGGQSFIMTAGRAETVSISGVGWSNTSGTAVAPMGMIGIEVSDVTPILALRGAIVDQERGLTNTNFRVIVKNRSTNKSVATVTKAGHRSRSTMWRSEGIGYQITDVDLETKRAAKIGDILEISAQSPHPLIGVEPLEYTVTAEDVRQGWIQLPALIAYEIPVETELLHNYPNPFNPETWIPYQLAHAADVTLTIYDTQGAVVRQLDLGYQQPGYYTNRTRAAYWDGCNHLGESVGSGVYFYHLQAADYSAIQKMVILK